VAATDWLNNSCIAAGIDIGSNTFRLLVARMVAGRLTVLVKELAAVRLCHHLAKNGVLDQEAISRALAVLEQFHTILDRRQPQFVRACGTAALRAAANRDAFLGPAQETLGIPIEIITGAEEARLSLAGTLAFMESPALDPVLLVDVGGGSTELAFAETSAGSVSGAKLKDPVVASLRLGVVGLTEGFLQQPRTTPEETAAMTGHIREHLTAALREIPSCPKMSPSLLVIGTGGTATCMAALDLDLDRYEPQKIQAHRLTRSGLDRIWQRLAGLSAADRNLLPGLQDGRGEILLAGVRIYQVLLEILDLKQMTVSDAGLLEGILLSRILDPIPGWR
jgi:exopolyphosphatase/guanosine-5'-triphosphate,3'-diphosphate pyrophosphatase